LKPEAARETSLKRQLGFWTVAAVVVANMVGTGIFTVTGFMARDVPDPLLILAIWLAGGLIALCGTLSVAELGAMLPYAGGEYVYLSRGLGPLWGFLSGWISFFAGFSAPIAAAAMAATAYLAYFFPAISTGQAHQVFLPVVNLPFSPGKWVSVAIILFFAGVHYLGLRSSCLVQNAITLVKLVALALFVAAGLYVGIGNAGRLAFSGLEAVKPGKIGVSLVFVMFAYSGWNAATYIAGEIRDPARNLSRALVAGIVTVTLLYLGLNIVYLLALPVAELSGVVRVGSRVALALFGRGITGPMTAVFTVSILACLGAMMLVGPRIYYAMALDGLFFRAFGRVHPRFATPGRAILLQAGFSAVLVLAGTFEQVLTYAGFMLMLFSALAVGMVFVFRRKRPAARRPYRTPGYPFTPLVFIVTAAWMMAYTAYERPLESLGGLLTLALGGLAYLKLRGRVRMREIP